MNNKFFFLILGISMFLGCGASKQERDHSEEIRATKERMAMDVPPFIPPNNCKVAATVIAIDNTMKGISEKDPCGKAPCMATVRIDSVLGYGSAFPKPLSSGERVSVKFAFTVHATAKEFPDVKPALPGLSVGSRFVALVSGAVTMGQTEPTYVVYGYEKK